MVSCSNPIPGPSKKSKSYAQAVKEIPSPRRPPNQFTSGYDIVIVDHGNHDDWTDVSSVTSCAWPCSVDAESVSDTRRHDAAMQNSSIREDTPDTPEDVVWMSCERDTRVPHSLAGQIKHINRSGWLYINCSQSLANSSKPWRRYPGCRTTRRPRDKYWTNRHQCESKTALRMEAWRAERDGEVKFDEDCHSVISRDYTDGSKGAKKMRISL